MAGIRTRQDAGGEVLRAGREKKVLETMQRIKGDLLSHVEERLNELTEEMTSQIKQLDNPVNGHSHDAHKYINRVKSDKAGALPEKYFLPRNSLLTDLFEISHIRTIYNIFIVILIVQFLNSALCDLVSGDFNLGLELIIWNFGGMRYALLIWLIMNCTTFALYCCFHFWANHRLQLRPTSWQTWCWDKAWLSALIVYQVFFAVLPVMCVFRWSLPPATTFAMLCEQIRMVMKSHAFVRSNVPRATRYKLKTESSEGPCPGFSHFLYFLFCPTMVYRDSYPRTREIRWGFVVRRLLEIVGVIFYKSFIFQRWLMPGHKDWGLVPYTPQQTVVLIFGSMMPAMMAFLAGFYCLLHAWLNAAAEMMRFADRMFYQDWWTAGSYGEYYRMWNVVVHDWLYMYVYRDIRQTFRSSGRFIPTMAVFFVSAIVHEYAIAITFGFCYPMMLITFGVFGASLTFIQSDASKGGNIFMWLCLLTGTGLLTSLYSMEYYARINCIKTHDGIMDFFMPRSWNCTPVS